MVQLHFDVMRVELPLESIRHSRKIWNHVDELELDPRFCALLARNGLRVGVADGDAWPAIEAVLEANHATFNRRQHAVESGYPLTLDLGPVRGGETYFHYDRRGRLIGTTFGEGRKYLHIDYAVDPNDPCRVVLTVTPEVHCESPDKRWTSRDGVFRQGTVYQGRMFTDLTATVSLRSGQFLVIGPSESAGIGSLMGSRFFERADEGRAREVLVLAAPQTFRTAGVER